ncbi:unnamed protein product [Arabidopsis halleri]
MAEEPATPSLIPNSNPTGCKIRTIFKRFNPDLLGSIFQAFQSRSVGFDFSSEIYITLPLCSSLSIPGNRSLSFRSFF